MKKTTIILLLVIQLFLMLIFQNIYSLFKGFENVDLRQIRDPLQLMNDFKRIKNVFSMLFVITSLFFLGTAIYLGVLFKRAKLKPETKGIPPLHDYLLELKGSEAELKTMLEKQQVNVLEKEELNKSIINNINSAVIFINQAGRIDIFNAVAQQLFSQSYANAKNNLPRNILSKYPGIVEFLNANADRKASAELASGDRVFGLDLNPMGNIGQLLMVKDITEEKKREDIDRSNSNFIMLGEMTAFLAHEVRNSLGVIYGYTKTIKTDADKIRKVNKEIHFLTAMMESFLAFSRPVEVHKREAVDLGELLAKIAGENELALEVNGDEMCLDSDPSLLHPVFSNLLLNAREAGAKRVEVSFTPKENGDLEIRLQDNGTGIGEDVKGKIWYPFFTTKEKGTGMGLAVIRKIINTLKGEISLAETGPNGTTFKIVFYH